MAWSRRVAGVLCVAAVLTALLTATGGVRGMAGTLSCPVTSPSPTASPSPDPSPSAAPTPDPCATPQPSPAPTPVPVPGTSTTATPPTPSAPADTSGETVSGPPPKDITGAVVRDPLLTVVDTVLPTPVAQQRPGLLHFAPPAGGASLLAETTTPRVDPVPGPRPASTGGQLILDAAVVAGLAALFAAFAAMLLRWRALPGRMRLILAGLPAAFALPLGGLAAATLLVSSPAPPPTPGAPVAPQASAQPLLKPHAAVAQATAVGGPWNTLLGIENALSRVHDQLAASDSAIAAVHDALLAAPADDQHTLRPGGAARMVRELATLVAGHQSLQTAYDRSLQDEYDFFVATSQSAPQMVQLQTGASHSPSDVSRAVSYDLTTVQTQLAQQAAVATATAAALNKAVPSLPKGRMPTFHAPLSGVVTQSFGPSQFTLEPPITFDGVFYPHFHTGLDIAAPLDAPVGAAAAGTVILATTSKDSTGALVGYGNYVVISHGNGVLTVYGHLDQLLVQVGQVLHQGQAIGLCGSTGWSTGPHVHFEIRINGQYVDPAPRLGADIRP